MEVLYTSSQVRQGIRKLFTESKGRRVVISAFVGSAASQYLPKPEGIELVCWPKAGGTNPDAIRGLIQHGVKVFFADNVHMKIYWTSDKGAIVTSANLSTNALGEGGLKEVGVLLPSSTIDINKIIKSLSTREASSSEILKLDEEHKAAYRKNPPLKGNNPANLPSFNEWYNSEPKSKWKLAWYWLGKVKLSQESKSVLERENGSHACEEILEYHHNYFKKSDWLLCLDKNSNQVVWMYADQVVKTASSTKKSRPYQAVCQILQVSKLRLRFYPPPPFKIDPKFRTAFLKALRDFGGTERMSQMTTAHPPKKLIELIHKYILKR
jgi:hypothetical protein